MLDFLVELFYKILDTLANLGDLFDILFIPFFLLIIYQGWKKHRKSDRLQRVAENRKIKSMDMEALGIRPVQGREQELEHLCCKAGVSSACDNGIGEFKISRVFSRTAGESQAPGITIFDAMFTAVMEGEESTHSINTDAQTLLLLEGVEAPDFTLFPETLKDRVLDLFSGMDIDFKDTPLFSQQFFLSGPEYLREGITRFFTRGLRKYLETKKGICIVSRDSRILVFRRNTILDSRDLRDLMDIAANLQRLVPQGRK